MTRLHALILILCVTSCSYLEGRDIDEAQKPKTASPVTVYETAHGWYGAPAWSIEE